MKQETSKEAAKEAAKSYYPIQTEDLICSPNLVRNAFIAGAEWQRQQQAFRWFREKHNIDAWVQPFVCEKQNGKPFLPDESYVYYIFKDGVYVDDAVNFLNYEEAELACLQKLIEIVKTK